MKIKTLISSVLLTAGLMTGCSTGAGGIATVGDLSITQSDITSGRCTTNGICGPMAAYHPQMAIDQLSASYNSAQTKTSIISKTGANVANISSGINTATGVAVAFQPELAPLFLVTTLASSLASAFTPNPTAQAISQLQQQMQGLQTQLNNLATQVNNSDTYFYNWMQTQLNSNVNSAFGLLNNNLLNIGGGVTGSFTNTASLFNDYTAQFNFSTSAGQENINASTAQTQFPYENNFANSSTMSKLPMPGTTFQNSVNSVSNTTIATDNSTGVVTLSPIGTTSNLVQAYSALQNQFYGQVANYTSGNSNSLNLATLISSYNSQVANIYQNALAALQTAYILESNNNLLNYLAVIDNNASNQIAPYYSIGSLTIQSNGNIECYANNTSVQSACTSFYFNSNPSASASSQYQAAYNNITVNLAAVYAYRINQLILTTVPYIISDPLGSSQILPTTQMQTDYNSTNNTVTVALSKTSNGGATLGTNNSYNVMSPSNLYSKAIPAMSLKNVSSTSGTSLLPGGSWQTNAIFYQFQGFSDYVACYSNTKTNVSTSCASFFPDMNNSYYSGTAISAYAPLASSPSGYFLTPLASIKYESTTISPSSATLSTWNNNSNAALYISNSNGYFPTRSPTTIDKWIGVYFLGNTSNATNVTNCTANVGSNQTVYMNAIRDKPYVSNFTLTYQTPDGSSVQVSANTYQVSENTNAFFNFSVTPITPYILCNTYNTNGGTLNTCTNALTGSTWQLIGNWGSSGSDPVLSLSWSTLSVN